MGGETWEAGGNGLVVNVVCWGRENSRHARWVCDGRDAWLCRRVRHGGCAAKSSDEQPPTGMLLPLLLLRCCQDILNAAHVDLVLAGHVHACEREGECVGGL